MSSCLVTIDSKDLDVAESAELENGKLKVRFKDGVDPMQFHVSVNVPNMHLMIIRLDPHQRIWKEADAWGGLVH